MFLIKNLSSTNLQKFTVQNMIFWEIIKKQREKDFKSVILYKHK